MADEMGLGKTVSVYLACARNGCWLDAAAMHFSCMDSFTTIRWNGQAYYRKGNCHMSFKSCSQLGKWIWYVVVVLHISLSYSSFLTLVKWLGESRVRPLVIDNAGSKEKITAVKRWSAAQGQIVNPGMYLFMCLPNILTFNIVLIISYETLRSYTKYLKKSPIGLLLCDEGHRLKNGCTCIHDLLWNQSNLLFQHPCCFRNWTACLYSDVSFYQALQFRYIDMHMTLSIIHTYMY